MWPVVLVLIDECQLKLFVVLVERVDGFFDAVAVDCLDGGEEVRGGFLFFAVGQLVG